MSAVKTAVIGASGYIGGHLWSAYNRLFPGTIGTSFSAAHSAFTRFDVREPDITPLRLEEAGYQAVMICAAKPNVGFCETNPEQSAAVNVDGTLKLIRQLAKTSLQTIFLSSDYVFDGSAGSYPDDAPVNPSTVYGRHKAAVEKAIPEITDNFLILRIGKIYGLERGDKTLLDEIAASLAAGHAIQCADDQIFCPTFVDDLTRSIMQIQSTGMRGLLNLCGPEKVSRYQVAANIAEKLAANSNLIRRIALYEIGSMIGRPLDTSMVCQSSAVQELQKTFMPLRTAIEQTSANYRPRVCDF